MIISLLLQKITSFLLLLFHKKNIFRIWMRIFQHIMLAHMFLNNL